MVELAGQAEPDASIGAAGRLRFSVEQANPESSQPNGRRGAGRLHHKIGSVLHRTPHPLDDERSGLDAVTNVAEDAAHGAAALGARTRDSVWPGLGSPIRPVLLAILAQIIVESDELI